MRASESETANLTNVAACLARRVRTECDDADLQDDLNKLVNAFDVTKRLPPKTMKEALEREDWEDWVHASDKEITGLMDVGVFLKQIWQRAYCSVRDKRGEGLFVSGVFE